MNLMRNLGGSVGISAATTLIARRQQVHQAYLARNTFQHNPQLQHALTGIAQRLTPGLGAAEAMKRAYGQIYGIVQRQAAVLAYIDTFWIMGSLCLLAVGLLFFARKNKPGAGAMAH
jgi:DHA2 family multidrug resistance protein